MRNAIKAAGWREACVVTLVLALVGVGAAATAGAIGRSTAEAAGPQVMHRSAQAAAEEAAGEAIEPLLAAAERQFKRSAPFDEIAPGAYAAAAADARKKPKTGNAWTPVGSPTLYANDPQYGPSALGWGTLSGRINAFAYDPAKPTRLFAAAAAGGVWETTDGGANWRSVGDTLPTQALGSVGFSAAKGGTIIAATGDGAIGGVVTPSGLGVYTSTNDGKSWVKAAGVPDGLVSFDVEVDPARPSVNYVATNKGLFRSTDNGATYTNVALPTPKVVGGVRTENGCAGDTTTPACTYATVVTDVAVRPGTGAVIAAVGYPYGQNVTALGITQAPQNGIYRSQTGAPGTFEFVNPGASAPTANGFAPTPVVGRTTLAVAAGPGQNHDYVYALVQDAKKLQGCLNTALEQPICSGTGLEVAAEGTFLDGAYVSKDFGRTWTKVMSWEQLETPGTGSALELGGPQGYGPGVQSWYNNWIAVDPTATDPVTGAPTRVLFGLEEIWENSLRVPVTGPTAWKVVGRYWNACLLRINGCSTADPIAPGTTTHPDQHAALFVPDATGGGVTLYAGNDGGAYKQHVGAGQDFSNENWGDGINRGLHTLQPYDAAVAKDGTIVAGLQDNGEIKILPDGRQDMIFGGDGFYTAIDPDNSNRIVEEYAYGRMSQSTDGGRTWISKSPSWGNSSATALFSAPLQLDPGNADHLMAGGKQISQTAVPYTYRCYPDETLEPTGCPLVYVDWVNVFDLGNVPGTTTARKATAVDVRGDYGYAAACGPCSVFTKITGFESAIVTNVGGSAPPRFGAPDGWHEATAAGLPDRYITSVRIDPTDPTGKTIYVTLGGYSSHWVPPGANGEDVSRVGSGHVFVSRDAGETFTDVSGDLPDAPANWVLQREGRLIVGTDLGVFISTDLTGGAYSRFGDLPSVPVLTIREDPGNPNRLIAATFGRGVYQYVFG